MQRPFRVRPTRWVMQTEGATLSDEVTAVCYELTISPNSGAELRHNGTTNQMAGRAASSGSRLRIERWTSTGTFAADDLAENNTPKDMDEENIRYLVFFPSEIDGYEVVDYEWMYRHGPSYSRGGHGPKPVASQGDIDWFYRSVLFLRTNRGVQPNGRTLSTVVANPDFRASMTRAQADALASGLASAQSPEQELAGLRLVLTASDPGNHWARARAILLAFALGQSAGDLATGAFARFDQGLRAPHRGGEAAI
ncbi:MAG: hypothetical protein SF028_00090 [Candidatus Sumerlaeia bacterium]|nr:hypothetical protein [Candidatus Sumerlaeia bacterium]